MILGGEISNYPPNSLVLDPQVNIQGQYFKKTIQLFFQTENLSSTDLYWAAWLWLLLSVITNKLRINGSQHSSDQNTAKTDGTNYNREEGDGFSSSSSFCSVYYINGETITKYPSPWILDLDSFPMDYHNSKLTWSLHPMYCADVWVSFLFILLRWVGLVWLHKHNLSQNMCTTHTEGSNGSTQANPII